MRISRAGAVAAYVSAVVAASIVAGCTTKPDIATITADGANLSGYQTFSMMTVPPAAPAASAAPAAGAASPSPTGGATTTSGGDVSSSSTMDPMLASSPVGTTIRTDIVNSFKGRGYAESSAPDFLIAYYAGTGDIVTIKAYPYGYSGASNVGKLNVTDYPAGSVIVDVIDAKTQALVWRGQGTAKIPNNPDMYSRELARTVGDIVAQFPKAGQKT